MEEGYISESVTIKCRICHKELLRKNYKQHLKTKHPTANFDDVTPLGQQKITDVFFKKKNDVPPSEAPSTSQSQEEFVDIDVEEPVGTRKRRIESGDSGVGEEGDSTHKRIRGEDTPASHEDITNKDLSDKLDKILKCVDKEKIENSSVEKDTKTVSKMIKRSRSMVDILEAGFEYDDKADIVTCVICEDRSTEFFYSSEHGLEFEDDEKLSREFVNLKSHIIRHLRTSKTHINALLEIEERERLSSELRSKNHQAGLNLGRICMKNYHLGRPYTDYEYDVLMLKKSGAVVGELNHSRKFPPAFRASVCKAVNRRVVKFIKTPLDQTGFLPPVGISADKGTYKHRSRQFLSVVVIMPGGNNLLEVLSCGQPVVTGGSSGSELAKNMKAGFDYLGVDASQIESGVFDGVYFHCSIEQHLQQLYSLKPGKVLYTWDPLHKTGLVDKHVAKQHQMEWLKEMIALCQQIFSTFNWGANYEKFREATALWRLTLNNLVNFSDTRFANSKRKVFLNIHHQFAPIITCLDDEIDAGVRNMSGLEASDYKVREKADKAKELKGRIMNVLFLFTLSGLVDIYEQFGVIVQVTQMVHLLPHERLDMYNEAVKRMKNMVLAIDHADCVKFFKPEDKNKCMWPKYHKDKQSYNQEKKIKGMAVLDKHEVEAAGLSILTRRQAKENIVRAGVEPDKKSDERLIKLVTELSKGLSDDVYSKEGKDIIEKTRVILDLPSLALKMKTPGESYIHLSVTEFPLFKNSIDMIPIESLRNVPDEELKKQFRTFLERLKAITEDMDTKDLEELDPKELIKKFFDPAEQLYKNIEMVMQSLAVSAVKHSCESVLESFVSRYENHFDSRRNTEEAATNEEFEIATNGPNIANCDGVVKEAMDNYWKGGAWHFFRTSVIEKVKTYKGNSEVMDRMMNKQNNLPFMT